VHFVALPAAAILYAEVGSVKPKGNAWTDLGINNCRAIFTGPRAIDFETVS